LMVAALLPDLQSFLDQTLDHKDGVILLRHPDLCLRLDPTWWRLFSVIATKEPYERKQSPP
jgi:hypothetical protein